MEDNNIKNESLIKDELTYKIEDIPPMNVSILLALQHILAAFAGIIAVPLVVCSALNLSVEDTSLMVSAKFLLQELRQYFSQKA